MKRDVKQNLRKFVAGIGFKFGSILFLVLAIIFTVKTVYDASKFYKMAMRDAEKIKLNETRAMSYDLEKKFSVISNAAESTKFFVENLLKNTPPEQRSRKFVGDYLVDLYEENEAIYGVGVYMEPQSFDKTGDPSKKFCAYAYKVDGVTIVDDVDDTEGANWYERAITEKRPILIEPAQDAESKFLASYATPILYDGEAVGCVVVDMEVKDLQSAVEEFTEGMEDFKLLLSESGTIIAHGVEADKINKNAIDFNPKYKDFIQVVQGDKEHIEIETSVSTGKKSKLIYVPVNVNGVKEKWIFGSITSVARFTREIRTNTLISIIVSILTLLFISVLVFVLTMKTVVRPLSLMKKVMRKMAAYDLNPAEEEEGMKHYLKNRDEVGTIIRSVKKVGDNLSEIIKRIHSYAQNTAATAQELTATSQSTASASEDVLAAVSEIAEGARVQAQDIKKAKADLNEADMRITEMLGTLEELLTYTHFVEEKKDEGNKSLSELAKAVEKSNLATKEVHGIIIETSDSVKNISSAREMIQSISDRTNLLALNAAIEAARAGEAGKGFAVVAEEIRKLAEQSAGFTEEIRREIDDLREKSEKAVGTMADVSSMFEMQNEKLKLTEEKFDRISESIEKSKAIVSGLDTASKKISEKNTEIAKVIATLSDIAIENVSVAGDATDGVNHQVHAINEISGASENLAEIATNLQEEVNRFRL